MNAERYLEQFETLSRRIAYHREHLLMLHLELDGLSSCWNRVSGGNGSGEAPYVRALENIERKKKELEQEEDLLQRLRTQIEETVDRLPDESMKQILLYRYLHGKNYVQIADILFMGRLSVTRRKKRAMELLEVPEDAIDIFSENSEN